MALKWGENSVTNLVYNSNTVNTLVKDGTTVWERPYTLTINVYGSSYIASYAISRTSTKEPTATTGELSSGATIYHEDRLSADATKQPTRYSYSDYSPASLSGISTTVVNSSTIRVSNTTGYTCTVLYGTSSSPSTVWGTSVESGSSIDITGLSPTTTYYFKLRTTAYRMVTPYTHSVSQSFISRTVTGNVNFVFRGSETAGTPYQDSTTSYAYSDIISATTPSDASWKTVYTGSISNGGRLTKQTVYSVTASDMGLDSFDGTLPTRITGFCDVGGSTVNKFTELELTTNYTNLITSGYKFDVKKVSDGISERIAPSSGSVGTKYTMYITKVEQFY